MFFLKLLSVDTRLCQFVRGSGALSRSISCSVGEIFVPVLGRILIGAQSKLLCFHELRNIDLIGDTVAWSRQGGGEHRMMTCFTD